MQFQFNNSFCWFINDKLCKFSVVFATINQRSPTLVLAVKNPSGENSLNKSHNWVINKDMSVMANAFDKTKNQDKNLIHLQNKESRKRFDTFIYKRKSYILYVHIK